MTPPTQQTPSEGVTRRTLRAAIAGNPNSGKTSLFNQLTGSNRCVGNYPGVTVERHEGTAVASGEAVHMVDLPGTYSLTAYSAEEVVARKVIIHEHPDVVVDVVDAANLERNLYLTVQLLEMETPLVIALNMLDVARRHELVIDTQRLSELLGIPVVETDARQGRGSKELIGACHQFGRSEQDWRPTSVAYGHPLDEHVERLSGCLAKDDGACRMYRPRWAAIKLLEKDPELRAGIERYADRPDAILRMADEAVHAIETHSGEDSETLVAEGRYGFAAGIVRQCVSTGPGQRRRLTDAIDSVRSEGVV